MVDDPGSKATEKTQRDRFIEAARQLGADDDAATFRAKLAVIARQKPKADPGPDPENEKRTCDLGHK